MVAKAIDKSKIMRKDWFRFQWRRNWIATVSTLSVRRLGSGGYTVCDCVMQLALRLLALTVALIISCSWVDAFCTLETERSLDIFSIGPPQHLFKFNVFFNKLPLFEKANLFVREICFVCEVCKLQQLRKMKLKAGS